MIEQLDGVKETVIYEKDARVKLFHNVQHEAYPLHWHAAMEIIMPLRNNYVVNVQDERIIVEQGDILIIPPGILHLIEKPKAHGERFIILCNTATMNEQHHLYSLSTFFTPYVHVKPNVDSSLHHELQTIIGSIIRTFYLDGHFKYISIYADLIKFVATLGNDLIDRALNEQVTAEDATHVANERTSASHSHLTVIYESCEYLRHHSRDDISLDDLANRAGFSKFYFSRLFKDFTGMSFVDYLNRCRISDAENLLSDPESVVTEVAMQVGFNSISTFNRVFRKFKNTTPTEFKQLSTSATYSGGLS